MPKTAPDHRDAELLLRVYELRRETVLRESRKAILGEFWPRSWDDVQSVLKPEHPLNVAYRQVGTYWEMVLSFVRHGIVHPAFWLENNGEGFFLYAKIEPFLGKIRESGQPTAFRNAEWVSKECPEGRPIYERIRDRVARSAAARG